MTGPVGSGHGSLISSKTWVGSVRVCAGRVGCSKSDPRPTLLCSATMIIKGIFIGECVPIMKYYWSNDGPDIDVLGFRNRNGKL